MLIWIFLDIVLRIANLLCLTYTLHPQNHKRRAALGHFVFIVKMVLGEALAVIMNLRVDLRCAQVHHICQTNPAVFIRI